MSCRDFAEMPELSEAEKARLNAAFDMLASERFAREEDAIAELRGADVCADALRAKGAK